VIRMHAEDTVWIRPANNTGRVAPTPPA
jgi:hypothetical protein